MNPLVSYWILDFVLRQPIEGFLVEELFLSLPAPVPLRSSHYFHKAILLRYLRRTVIVSEQTLHALELIEELDRNHPINNETKFRHSPLLSLRAAYCAVATECTVRHLRDSNIKGFSDAVFRIWNCRVADLQVSEAAKALFSQELEDKSREMEKAVGDSDIRDRLLRASDAEDTTLMAIRAYVDDAFAEMGPSCLELKAEEMLRNGRLGHGLVGSDETTALEIGSRELPPLQLVGDGRMSMPPPSPERPASDSNASSGEAAAEQVKKAPNKDGIPPVHPPAGVEGQNVTNRFNIKYNKRQAGTTKEPDILSTPETNHIMQALKSSCAVLRTVVEDPLPSAIAKGAELVDGEANDQSNAIEQEYHLNHGGDGDPGPSNRVMDADCSDGTAIDRQVHVDRGKHVRSSLMDRNATAHTFEWEDSIESSSEGSPSCSKRIRLPSLKQRRASPLNVPKPTKYARRRAVKKWSAIEEETLREGVKKHGKGNWKFILNCYPSIFEHRTEVDLKDKWRNMTR